MSPQKDVSGVPLLNRREFLTAVAGTVAGVTAFGLEACGGPVATGTNTTKGIIGFSFPFRTVDVYKPLIAGAKEEAALRGYSILESFSEVAVDKQIAELDTWIAQRRVNALVILPVDSNAIAPPIQKAHDAGIVVVGYSDQLPGEDGYNIFDHRQGAAILGEEAGNWVKQQKGGQAEVGLLTFETIEVGRLRIHGAVTSMQGVAPGAKVVASTQATSAAEALTATQSMLQAHPNISVLICVNDDDVIGAGQAFKAAGRSTDSVWIGGFDGSKAAMQKILSGEINGATAALHLKAIGRAVAWIPANILEKKEPTFFSHPYILITHDTQAIGQQLIADFGS